MQNLLFVSPTGAMTNGAERAGLSLMEHLTRSGFRVVNAYPKYEGEGDPIPYASYRASMESSSVRALPLDFGWWIPGDEEFSMREFLAINDLISAIETHDIDVVVTNTSNVPWGALAAAFTNRQHSWLLHEFPTGPFGWLFDKYDFIGNFSTHVFCASPSLTEDVRSRINTSAKDVPVKSFRPFSDTSSVILGSSTTPRIAVVGAVNRRKNQLEVVRAAAHLQKKGLSPSVIFIGDVEDHDYFAEIREAVRDGKLSDQVTFLGHQDNPWSFLSPIDIVVQPSIAEVFSLVACEAAGLGLRLVLARNRSSVDIAALLGEIRLYDVGEADELANAIAEMFDNQAATLQAASRLQLEAERVLSASACYLPIVESLSYSGPAGQRPGSALAAMKPFFTSHVNTASVRIEALSRRLEESENVRDTLEADRSSLREELARIYVSHTWRFGLAFSLPFRVIRGLWNRSSRAT